MPSHSTRPSAWFESSCAAGFCRQRRLRESYKSSCTPTGGEAGLQLVELYSYRFRLLMRFFGSHSDGQSLQAVRAGNSRLTIAQHSFDKISYFFQVSFREPRKEMICESVFPALRGKKYGGHAIHPSDEDRALRADDLGAHVISINGLRVGLYISDGAFLILQIHYAGDHIAIFDDIGANRAGG